MEESQKKAFDIATEVSKQLISLATGITGLTVTFATNIFPTAPPWLRYVLAIAWVLYLASALFGIATLMCLAGGLEKPKNEAERFSIYKTNVMNNQKAQAVLFALATVAVVVFGISGVIWSPPTSKPDSRSYMKVESQREGFGRATLEVQAPSALTTEAANLDAPTGKPRHNPPRLPKR